MSYYLLITIYYSLFKELVPFYIRIFGTKFRYYKPKDRQIILDYQCMLLNAKTSGPNTLYMKTLKSPEETPKSQLNQRERISYLHSIQLNQQLEKKLKKKKLTATYLKSKSNTKKAEKLKLN